MSAAGELHGRSVRVVHSMPGRLRLRLPAHVATGDPTEAVNELPGVLQSVWNPRTRSVLVHYRPDDITPLEIASAVADHADVDDVVMPPETSAPEAVAPNGHSAVSVSLTRAFGEMNQRLSRATRGTLDLRGAFPLALGIWAFAELLRGRVGPLSWSSALWYAHGLFRDYNVSDR